MWHRDYQDRLVAWVDLRTRCQRQTLPDCLQTINRWWQSTPWQPYYLHWDDRRCWPDPWQLLADDVFCDVARALGMLYTIQLIDREDCADASMVMANLGNLVLVDQAKYIMNWSPDTVLNIPSKTINIQAVLEPSILHGFIR